MQYRLEKVIEVDDWDKLVENTYGLPYNFQQQDGCQSRGIFHLDIPISNDEIEEYDYSNESINFDLYSDDEMGIKFEIWKNSTFDEIKSNFPDDSDSSITTFIERNFYPAIQVVANDLFNKGLIEEGSYLINIDW